jgi:hypothetical protein
LFSVPGRASVLLSALSFCVPIVLAVSVSALFVPIYVVRYVSFAAGSFWTLVVCGLLTVPVRALRWVLGCVMLAGVVVNLPALYDDHYYSRADLRSAASFVHSNWQPGDLVVHTSEFSAVPFAYYHGGRLEEVLLPEGDEPSLLEAATGYQRIWLIRDFGLADPTQADATTTDSLTYLARFRLRPHFEFLGVHVFLAEATPPPSPSFSPVRTLE